MWPWSLSIIDGKNAFVVQKCEIELTSNVFWITSSFESIKLSPPTIPALLIKIVILPARFSDFFATSYTCCRLVTSTLNPYASPPLLRILWTVFSKYSFKNLEFLNWVLFKFWQSGPGLTRMSRIGPYKRFKNNVRIVDWIFQC